MTQMVGSRAQKFPEKYTLNDINYTDFTSKYKANMQAQEGVYRNDTLELFGRVHYTSLQQNKLEFITNHLLYDKNNSMVQTDTNYTIYYQFGKVQGNTLVYDMKNGKIRSQNVQAQYDVQ